MNTKIIGLIAITMVLVLTVVVALGLLMMPSTPVAPRSSANPNANASVSSAANSSVVAGPGRGRGMMGGGQPAGGLTAIVNNASVPNPVGVTLPQNAAMQKIGNTNVTIALTPYPPVSFQTGNFVVTLADEQGQAITDAKVSIDLTMPGMWMPPSKPEAAHVGNGKYEASARWTMRGLWRMEVIIVRGGTTQSAFFDVWL